MLHSAAMLRRRFNTQPPEGGWIPAFKSRVLGRSFNTQPPEGGWVMRLVLVYRLHIVSTHSRPKAAGFSY